MEREEKEMRLTKKHNLGGAIAYTYGDKNLNGFTSFGKPITKLCQIEDIEEKLGIDLLDILKDKNVLWLIKCYIDKKPFIYAPRKELEK